VTSALDTYRQHVLAQPTCEAQWFAQALVRFRGGDEAAAREISARCLQVALRFAEDRAACLSSHPLFDLIQEANAGLMVAIRTFDGHSLAEFLTHAEEQMNQRLLVLS
jgi:DNA-directed RNA polymerase sigma subunit (sigma70/sigma32)